MAPELAAQQVELAPLVLELAPALALAQALLVLVRALAVLPALLAELPVPVVPVLLAASLLVVVLVALDPLKFITSF